MATLEADGCQDKAVSEQWLLFWNSYVDAMSNFYGNNVSNSAIYVPMMMTANAMKERGCEALRDPELEREVALSVSWCAGGAPKEVTQSQRA